MRTLKLAARNYDRNLCGKPVGRFYKSPALPFFANNTLGVTLVGYHRGTDRLRAHLSAIGAGLVENPVRSMTNYQHHI